VTAYLTYHEILSASGLQEVGAEGGGREAGEGVLMQDYRNNLQLTLHEYFAAPGLQVADAEGRGCEASEGELR
jgi:predicted acyl esterase